MNAENVAELLMKLSPVKYACDWDNVGMHVGHKDNEINTILVTLDIDDAAIDRAIEINADMIVSHHPLIFHGIKQINDDNITGRRIMRLIENRINAYCMHTNYDCVGGMAHAAASRLSMSEDDVLEETCDGEGIGRTGRPEHSMTAAELCGLVKEKFGLSHVILYGDELKVIDRISICPGSGKEYTETALKQGAQVLITGDMSYHVAADAVAEGLCIIDAGHYGIEHIFIDEIMEYLKENTDNIEIAGMSYNNPQHFI